jgi:hypothetical protein
MASSKYPRGARALRRQAVCRGRDPQADPNDVKHLVPHVLEPITVRKRGRAKPAQAQIGPPPSRRRTMKRYKVTVTTAADGTVTAYSPRLSGEIHQIEYVKTDYANGVDFTITGEATGVNLWTRRTSMPRRFVATAAGDAQPGRRGFALRGSRDGRSGACRACQRPREDRAGAGRQRPRPARSTSWSRKPSWRRPDALRWPPPIVSMMTGGGDDD